MEEEERSEIYRLYLLITACGRAEDTEIDGVQFALFHHDLDRSDWEPSNPLGLSPRLDPFGPRLLFPWATEQDKFDFNNRGEGLVVRPGDRLTIASVIHLPIKSDHGGLDHPHHRERRWARIAVSRPNGRQDIVQQSWEFRGVADVINPINVRDYKKARSALEVRLARMLGEGDVDDLTLATDRSEWEHLKQAASPAADSALEALWLAEKDLNLDAAISFGYLLGRAEAADLLLPAAERHSALAEKNRQIAKRPRKGGIETRLAAANLILENPNITRRKCAERVAHLRKLNDTKSVERTIQGLFVQDADGKYRANVDAARQLKQELGTS
jgi:hypothetical protein